MRTYKKRPSQVDAKELPRQSHKTLVFLTYFANFTLRDPFGGRSQRAPHFEHKQANIDFMMFLTPSLSPTWGTKRNIKNIKTSARLHGSDPAEKKRAPRYMGTLSQFGCSRWIPQNGSPKNLPNHYFQTRFGFL